MRKLIVGIALIATSAAGQAQSPSPHFWVPGGFIDGNTYQRFGPQERQVYLEGVFDGMVYAPVIAEKNLPRAVKLHDCVASHGMSNTQITAIVDKYMAETPERWGDSMGNITYTAMILACRKLGSPMS